MRQTYNGSKPELETKVEPRDEVITALFLGPEPAGVDGASLRNYRLQQCYLDSLLQHWLRHGKWSDSVGILHTQDISDRMHRDIFPSQGCNGQSRTVFFSRQKAARESAERGISELVEIGKAQDEELEKLRGEILTKEHHNTSLKGDLEKEKAALARAEKKNSDLSAELDALQMKLEDGNRALVKKQNLLNSLKNMGDHFSAQLANERQQAEGVRLERDKFKKLLEDQASSLVLGRGNNIQGDFPTLPELVSRVKRTLTQTVSEWMENFEQSSQLAHLREQGVNPASVLTALFRACNRAVNFRYKEIELVFLGEAEDLGESKMDSAMHNFMRQHLRRHYLTLFHVAGGTSEPFCFSLVIEMVRDLKNRQYMTQHREQRLVSLLIYGGIEKVVTEYLGIMVASILQNPMVAFSDDLGQRQRFEAADHFPPIDGNKVRETCVVVFPAMLVQQEQGKEARKYINRRFVLVDL